MKFRNYSYLKYGLSLGLMGLTSCQLLRPYHSPLTPTPTQWKRTYSAPDANQPAIPPETWKNSPTDSSQQIQPNAEISYKPNDSCENTPKEEDSEENKPEPRFEDVCKELNNWWEIFNDPVLNQLEERALQSSYTLWAALERITEARELARINRAPLLPNLSVAPSFLRSGMLIQNPLTGIASGANGSGAGNVTTRTFSSSSSSSSGGTTTTGTGAATTVVPNVPNVFRYVSTEYLYPLNLNYEIDLWGKLDNTYYAALIRSEAATQAYLSVLLSLTTDVAANYFQLRGLDTQQKVIQNNIRVRQDAVNINQARYKAGLAVYVDVTRAEVELAIARADSVNVRRLRGLQENIIATLLGVPASIFSLEYSPVIIPPPVIPTGIPCEILTRRPDIMQAERNLAATYRDIGVAYANFFPSLSVNAAFGFESPVASKLFTWQSRFWEVGWNVFQSVFDAGRNEANYQYYKAIFRETMANYEQTVLNAFKDVEDALVNLKEYADQEQELAIGVRAARETLKLSQLRYTQGLVNYLDVVDAERSLLETEQNSVIILGNRYVASVQLIRALGGGWGRSSCWEQAADELNQDPDCPIKEEGVCYPATE